MLDNMFGIIPYLLSFIGLKSDFFGSYTAAMPTIIALDVWWQTSFCLHHNFSWVEKYSKMNQLKLQKLMVPANGKLQGIFDYL